METVLRPEVSVREELRLSYIPSWADFPQKCPCSSLLCASSEEDVLRLGGNHTGSLYSWSLKSSGGDVWKDEFYVIKCNCDDNSSVGFYKSLKWRPDLCRSC